MQQPTLRNVRIRSAIDAHQVFYGVARNILPLIVRRLDVEERRAIVSGNIYVWEERGSTSEAAGLGMERWTDGMGWGPSRVRDEFLFYHQKESEMSDDFTTPLASWAEMIRTREQLSSVPASVRLYPLSRAKSEAERLIKQTYTVRVSLPADRPQGIIRKWHLTAYYTQQQIQTLPTIDGIPGVGDVAVPEGWFKSARVGKSRNRDVSANKFDHSFDGPHKPSTSQSEHRPTRVAQSLVPPEHRYPPLCQSTQSPEEVHGAHRKRACPTQRSRHQNHRHSSSSSNDSVVTPSPPLVLKQLVPLEYLENATIIRREPADEQLLSLFSTQAMQTPSPPMSSGCDCSS